MIELKRSRERAAIEQSAVIPWRIRRGELQIALVTARSGPHWTIPKGHVEPDLEPHESAAKEAFEEAGLIGIVSGVDAPKRIAPVGWYGYRKRGELCRVAVFGMEVTRELRSWPEMRERRRRWFNPHEAAARVANAELRSCLQSFSRRSQPRRRSAAA